MKIVKKITGIMISLMIMVAFIPAITHAADGSGLSGAGTESSPYEVSSADDLDQMVSMVNSGEAADKYFVLTADITMTGDNTAPMGSQATPFAGSFDGQNHKITGFRQRLTADDGIYGGLFGYASNAIIKNIVMEAVNVNNTGANANVGGIIGYMKRVSNFSAARQKEAARRYYATDHGEISTALTMEDVQKMEQTAQAEQVAKEEKAHVEV